MKFHHAFSSILAILQTRLSKISASVKKMPWVCAFHIVRQARRHRSSSTSVALAMLQRYPACYLVNGDYTSLPRIELAEYRVCQVDYVPLIRVRAGEMGELIKGRQAYMTTWENYGATLVQGNGEMPPFATGRDIIRSLANNGWHVLTVDDARRVLEGRDIARSQYGYLTTYNGWLSDVEKDADAIGIAESLFPFCEEVVESQAAVIVVHTPGLPRPLRLWRLELRWIMPPLPPIA
jgi:hypothetical protein